MNFKKMLLGLAALSTIISVTGCKKVDEPPAETTLPVITQMTTAAETTAVTTESTAAETVREPLVPLERFAETLEKYPEVAGHITVPGTNVDYDFVQTTDNEFYMYRDMDGNDDKRGTIFLDFRCKFNDYSDMQSDNIILHGHNMADLSMFGSLKNYKIKHSDTSNFSFYLDHPTFTVSNLYEEYTYKIIAVFVIEVEEWQTRDGVIFDYHNYVNFTKKRSFNDWIENVNKRSQIITGVDVNKDDKFITLNTCSNEFNNSRFVTIARRVRDGESAEVDTSKAMLNEDALEPDWSYIYDVAGN
ncbi:MAG: class B sortase [Oscillospiraceae bacterium]|nr:class B sortase [Oscillospiraceae bacterium]